MFKKNQEKQHSSLNEIDIHDAIKIKSRLDELSQLTEDQNDKDALLKASQLISTLIAIYGMWGKSQKTIKNLLRKLFGKSSEKINTPKNNENCNELKEKIENDNQTQIQTKPNDQNDDSKINNSEDSPEKDKIGRNKRKGGNGKNSADEYTNCTEITCKLEDQLQPGEICPECGKSRLYEINEKKVVRLVGHAPVQSYKYFLQQTRCVCGIVFTAKPPEEFKDLYYAEKYSPSALASLIIHKYFLGTSFGMIDKVQKMMGVPVPASTQVNQIKQKGLPVIQAIVGVFKFLASNSRLLGFDDTHIRLLEKRITQKNTQTNKGYGTAIIADGFDREEHQIILYDFDYSIHAGEAVFNILKNRVRNELPLLISDGLPAYLPYKKDGINANCNSHMRRKVYSEDPNKKTVLGNIILTAYKEIYQNDRHCKEKKLSPFKRMIYHQKNSMKHFLKMKAVFQIITGTHQNESLLRKEYKIPDCIFQDEPNSDVFIIAKYFLDRFDALTKIMKIPGVPLDTNYVERAIKIILKIRNNSLFFHNNFSAKYSGDILSLTETTNINKINIFDYLDYIIGHSEEVLKNPKYYLPWLYDKSNQEKEIYWRGVDLLIQSPSNFPEVEASEYCHS